MTAALLADRGITPGADGVPLEIDPRDEMLSFLLESHRGDLDRALFSYYRSGLTIADSLSQILAWRFGEVSRVGKLLDFASGYGRVTRFLLRDLPPERLWVSDIYAGAVELQRERFGVHGFVSAIRPEDLQCSERFDAILVTSLFTHLPEERFVAWLRVLGGLLQPGGLLVVSVHDQAVLAPGQEIPEAGIRFERLSESTSLETSDYGSTWVTEAFVRRALERALPAIAGKGGLSVQRIPRGLCNFQDLYAIVLEPDVDFSSLSFYGEPEVYVEHCHLTGADSLRFSGWAVVRGPHGLGRMREIQVLLDGRLLGAGPVGEARPDVAGILGEAALLSGWKVDCKLPPGTSRSGAVLMIRAVDGRGAVEPVDAGSVEWALLESSRRDVRVLQGDLHRAEVRQAEERAWAAAQAQELRTRIAAMEASRFWKMRNAWFRMKRALGLTEES